jgi:hypothetical protein
MGKFGISVDLNHKKVHHRFRDWVVLKMLYALLPTLSVMFKLGLFTLAIPFFAIATTHAASVPGNLNADQRVDFQDFAIFSSFWLDSNCTEPAWCGGSDINRDQAVDGLDLLIMMDNWLLPETSLLTVQDTILSPTRLAAGPEGTFYVTDSRMCSVFICDPNMTVIGQLRGLDRPLGIAVDSAGNFYVGNDGRNNVEYFTANGIKVRRIGEGVIKMPNDIKIGPDGKLYICDSKSDLIRVYDPNGVPVRLIGQGQLRFPSAIEIATVENEPNVLTTELYVADQGHHQVKVFDLQGTYRRSFGSIAYKSMMGSLRWQGRFTSIQSLVMDDLGRLHALDSAIKKVQILDPNTPAGVHTTVADYIDSYGQEGTGPGQLKTPLDIAIGNNGNVGVANTGNGRIEVIYTVP